MMSQSPITSLHAVLDAGDYAVRTLGTTAWWRGQASASWMLVPGVYRGEVEHYYEYEGGITTRFLAAAPSRRSSLPDPARRDQWLVLMQHYGLPTRLLDWTESILIATFFAVCDRPSEDGVLWGLSPFTLNEYQIGMSAIGAPGHASVRDLFLPPFELGVNQTERIVAFLATETDARMLMQQSSFTIHGTALALEQLESQDKFLLKWIIPSSSSKLSLLSELSRLGIRQSYLFPDLEHLAQELAGLKFDFRTRG